MVRVRDPIHDYIDLNDLEVKLIDTSFFQRLRWIRQLGPTNLVYPGANHTRFEHSLGTYHLARKIADAIDLEEDEKQLVSVSGLLHDIGHTVFSHLGDEIEGIEDHVTRTTRIVSESNISDYLENEGMSSKEVNDIIEGQHKLGPLVSGDLDADRLDYLVRDAHYTGVSTGVDTSRLIATMSMYNNSLFVRESSLPAVEVFLTTRSIMYPTVYFHPFARGAQLMLSRATKIGLSNGNFSTSEFSNFTEHKFLSELGKISGLPQSICKDFEKRNIVKCSVSITKAQVEESGLKSSEKQIYEESIASKIGIDSSQIYVDLPSLKVAPSMKVKILKADGQVDFAHNLSRVVAGLYEAQFDHWRGRVYGPSNYSEEITKEASKILGL